jgi:NADH-quinone oxidoreductase subunit L
MLGPLVVLAIGSIAAGYRLFPGAGVHPTRVALPDVLTPVFRLGEHHLPNATWVPAVATASAVLGILIAWYLYLAMPELRASLARALRPALRVFSAKYFFDAVYDAFVKHVVVAGSRTLLWERVDAGLIDGTVNKTATLVRALAETLKPVQTGFVRHYALLVLAGAVALVSYLLHSAGRLQP